MSSLPIRNLRLTQAASQRPQIDRLASQPIGKRPVDGLAGSLAPPMELDAIAPASTRSSELASRLRIRPDTLPAQPFSAEPQRSPVGLQAWSRRPGRTASGATPGPDPLQPSDASGPDDATHKAAQSHPEASRSLHRVVALSRQLRDLDATPQAPRPAGPSARSALATAVVHQLGSLGAVVGASTAVLPGGESAASRLRLLADRAGELADRCRRADEPALRGGPAQEATPARALARIRRLAACIDDEASRLKAWLDVEPAPTAAPRPNARAGGRFPLEGAVVRSAAESRDRIENLRTTANRRPDPRDSPWSPLPAHAIARAGAPRSVSGNAAQPVSSLRANPVWNAIGSALAKQGRPVDRTMLAFAERATDMGRSTVRFGRGAHLSTRAADTLSHRPDRQVDRPLLERADRAITSIRQGLGFVPVRR